MTWERRLPSSSSARTQAATFHRQPSDECATQSRHEETRMTGERRLPSSSSARTQAATFPRRPSDECGDAVADMRRRG